MQYHVPERQHCDHMTPYSRSSTPYRLLYWHLGSTTAQQLSNRNRCCMKLSGQQFDPYLLTFLQGTVRIMRAWANSGLSTSFAFTTDSVVARRLCQLASLVPDGWYSMHDRSCPPGALGEDPCFCVDGIIQERAQTPALTLIWASIRESVTSPRDDSISKNMLRLRTCHSDTPGSERGMFLPPLICVIVFFTLYKDCVSSIYCDELILHFCPILQVKSFYLASNSCLMNPVHRPPRESIRHS